MKNDEIRQTNRKALPKFLLFAIACVLAGGVIGYASGYGAANGGVAQLAGMLKEAGAFFGARFIGVQRNWLLRGMVRTRTSQTRLTESCLP